MLDAKRLAEIRERLDKAVPPRDEAEFLQASAMLIDLADLLAAHEALTVQVAALHETLGDCVLDIKSRPYCVEGADACNLLAQTELVLADTAAAAEAFKRQVIDQWLNDNVPERYHYTSGPDGTPETAFGMLCKDALEAMPGNKRQQRLEGARKFAEWFNPDGCMWLAQDGGGLAQLLAQWEREASA